MTTWTIPATIDTNMSIIGSVEAKQAVSGHKLSVIARTQATPLAMSKEAIKTKSGAKKIYLQQFHAALLGEVGGCLGETSAVMIALGGLYMIIRKTINPQIPLAVLASTFVFALIAHLINPDAYMSPLVHIVSGGLVLCAFFITTDPVTAPLTTKGMWIFGIGVGALTMLIRTVGEYPGGVMYSVLLMNALTPLIDRLCKLKPAGGVPSA